MTQSLGKDSLLDMTRRTLAIGLVILSHTLFAHACLWDRDTTAQEGQKHVALIETVVGLFDRYPPLYYQMRLESVTAQLQKEPHRLDLYDDAGVACARLGRPEEAMQWMARKKAVLTKTPSKDHEYRHLANLGTFYLQRWALHPHKKDRLVDLDEAIGLITQALKVNPGAHFGREQAQLHFMKWLRAGYPEGKSALLPSTANIRGWLDMLDYEGWPRALQGLIRQGIAWESVDAFNLLSTTTGQELGYLISLRSAELLRSGAASLQTDEAYLTSWAKLDSHGNTAAGATRLSQIDTGEARRIEAFYQKARRAANQHQEALEIFMLAKLRAGLHPDTNRDFWNGWENKVSLPPLPFGTWFDRFKMLDGDWLFADAALYGLMLGCVALLAVWMIKGLRFLTEMFEG